MWKTTDKTIEDLLPEIDGFMDGPGNQHPSLWFEAVQGNVLRKGWERVGEGSYAAVYSHYERPDVLLKFYDWDHHMYLGPHNHGTIHDADVMERLGDDDRCMQLVARHPLAVVLTLVDGEDLWGQAELDAIDIEEQLAGYIRFCVEKGVVPLDLSPSNVFYDGATLRFIDYAMYRLLEDFTEHNPGVDPIEHALYEAMCEIREALDDQLLDRHLV